MSTPSGPLAGLLNMIRRIPDEIEGGLNHVPGAQQSVGVAQRFGLAGGMPSPHQVAIDQMNADMNAHNNDAANESFRQHAAPPSNLSTMKKPLKAGAKSGM